MARRPATATLLPGDLAAAVAERAYFKAEQRGFVPGHELEDWLAAEREVSALAAPAPASTRKAAARRKNGRAVKTKKK